MKREPENLSAARVERVELPDGRAGIDKTVEVMSKAAMGRYGAGSPKIRMLAIKIVREAGVKEKDTKAEIIAIHEWVKKHLRYIKDPVWYEMVTHPETLAFAQADGDCDDHVVLEAALLGSIGIPSRFVTVGFNGPAMSHVYMQAFINNKAGWIDLDPIVKDKPAGWSVPQFSARKIYGLSGVDGSVKPRLSIIPMLVGVAFLVLVWRGRKWLDRKITGAA